MFRDNRLIEKLCLLFLFLALSACQTTPELSVVQRANSSEEVANVYVSAYPPVPWSEIASKLEPKHNLSTAEARALASITTQSQVTQFLSTFAAGLALGGPSKTSSHLTTIDKDGTVTTTGTRKIEPGAIPTNSGAAPLNITDANLSPDLGKSPFANGTEATTQLIGGTAVFQLAQILDNQITKSLSLKGYQAHLVTFQINLQPKRGNLPYDAYVNLTLMPGSWDKAKSSSRELSTKADALPPVVVYPLVITDAMESSTVGRSIETIRQAAVSLAGIVNNFGINAGLSRSSDNLDAILGSDRNSLVTVGRISDHTLRVRIGAQQQGSRKLALTTRSQNASVVVFTRAGESIDQYLDMLAVITETTFVDVDTGEAVVSTRNTSGRDSLREKVETTIKNYGFRLDPQQCKNPYCALDFLRSLDRGDYLSVSKMLKDEGSTGNFVEMPANLPVIDEARLRRLIASLMTVQSDSRFSKLNVPLTPYRQFVLPDPGQLVFLNDDSTSLKAVLRGGSGLVKDKFQARLKLTQNAEEILLLPEGMEIDPSGTTVTIGFPSLLGNKLMSAKKNPIKGKPDLEVDPSPMRLELLTPVVDNANRATVLTSYGVRLLRPEAKPIGNPVTVTSSVLAPDSSGTAKINLAVAEWDATTQGSLAIRVSGADVRSVQPAIPYDAKRGAIPVSGTSVVTLTLGNLSASQIVQIRTLSGKEPVGQSILLAVQPAPHPQ